MFRVFAWFLIYSQLLVTYDMYHFSYIYQEVRFDLSEGQDGSVSGRRR